MIKIQYTDPKLVSPQPGHVRPSVGALGGRPEVQGVRQGAQGAAPSLASLELRSQREGRAVRGVDLGQLCNHCLPGSSVALGGGGACCAMQNSTELEQIGNIYSKRIFLVHIITNNQQMANKLLHVLFPYKVSKITQH